ncbi:methylated-DNA--[protein]-cysteine S-methyltransferase [Ruania albidiflava]|uniref:methylated-DNA--[protein]-cysteine S-methyltransferase n=1 Tax=Ruania albidiflava TaxID=366586 RepID=UPI0003B72EFA|nr:methylated-DNA--[protein]-cysteine S-methyltransferase [Ruania albidiflava]
MRLTRALDRPDDDAHLADLHAHLAQRAEQDQLLDVSYRTVASPVGELLLATTQVGLVRVAFAREDFDQVLSLLADRVGPRILAHVAPLDAAARELEEYFTGQRRRFDLPLDLRLTHGFRRRVVEQLPTIDYGSTASYAEMARRAGSERAVRAVGSACATNPLPVVLPCHRVLRTDGSLGGYLGGPEAKRTLLALEAA